MTNGEKIKATFPHYDIEIDELKGYVRIFYENFYTTYNWDWWNSEYKEPTTKNNLGGECILRADAIRVASGYCHPSNTAKELAKLPPVTPIRPKGHWREVDVNMYACSKCSHVLTIDPLDNAISEMNTCPFCSADMRESEVNT